MAIKWLQGKKKEKTAAPESAASDLAPSFTRALSAAEASKSAPGGGKHFRSSSWQHLDSPFGDGHHEYMIAIGDETGTTWQIKRITSYIDPLDNNQVITQKSAKESCGFFRAMMEVARYEAAQAGFANYKKIEQELTDHFVNFAHKEEIIFNREGAPCLIENGFPVGDYEFSASEMAICEAIREKIEAAKAEDRQRREELAAQVRAKQEAERLREQALKPPPVTAMVRWEGGQLKEIFGDDSSLSGSVSEISGDIDFDTIGRHAKYESCLMHAQEQIRWGFSWFGMSGNWLDWNSNRVDRGAYENFEGNMSYAINHLNTAIEASENDEQARQVFKKIKLNLLMLRSAYSYLAVRTAQYPGGSSEKSPAQKFRENMDENFFALDLFISEENIDPDMARKVKSYVIAPHEFSEIMDAFVLLQTEIGNILPLFRNVTDQVVQQTMLAQVAVPAAAASAVLAPAMEEEPDWIDREYQIGDKMPDGTIYCGALSDSGGALYAMPVDTDLKMTWVRATEYAKNILDYGHGDWRLPTVRELENLYQNRNRGALNNSFQVNLEHFSSYWASEEILGFGVEAFYVRFTDGRVDYDSKSGDTRNCRLVRTGPKPG